MRPKDSMATLCSIALLAAAIATALMGAISFAMTSSATVTATMVVASICTVSLSNTAVNFGTVEISGNAPTANDIADTNEGNIAANILLDGTNWVYSSNSFFSANTIWDFSSHSGGVSGNTLGLAPGNIVDTSYVLDISQKADLFFGTQVPNQQAVGTYSQTITIENKC